MIVIDEGAETRLAQRIEELRIDPDRSRCIYLKLAERPPLPGIRERIINAAQHFILSSDPQLFFCDDGDVILLAPNIPAKEGNAYILDALAETSLPADEDTVEFFELPLAIDKLIRPIKPKLEKIRLAELAARRQRAEEELARKRHAILETLPPISTDEIERRRRQRSAPELMVIEDDAFTHRLLENVLQSRFSLTGLHSADTALLTYSRIAPDVLFLDINLPNVTGHELLERIIALDPNAYVIMLSGNCDRENISQAIRLGAKGFIGKPFTRDKLFQYLDRCPTIAHQEN